MIDIIGKLNRMRLERNLSVYRLAELSGINQSTLANTFSRGTVPSVNNLEILCETMGVTLAQFFTDSECVVSLTPEEARFFSEYKKLPAEIRHALCDIAHAVAASGQYDACNE